MKKIIFVALLFGSFLANAQVTYQTVNTPATTKPKIDSSKNLDALKCSFDPPSLVGQEIFFTRKNPNYKGRMSFDDTLFLEFNIAKGGAKNLYKPFIFKAKSPGAIGVAYTPYHAIQDKIFKVTSCVFDKDYHGDCQYLIGLTDPAGIQITWTLNTVYLIKYHAIIKGYMDKLKNTYLNKVFYMVIDPGVYSSFYNPFTQGNYNYPDSQKFVCTDVNLLMDDKSAFGQLYIILTGKDSKGNINNNIKVGLTPEIAPNVLWTEKKYLAYTAMEKRVNDSINNLQRNAEITEQANAQARHDKLIKAYGNENGTLIYNGEVKLGMSEDMCRESWGRPDGTSVSVTADGSLDIWHYRGEKWLQFKKGLLVNIIY